MDGGSTDGRQRLLEAAAAYVTEHGVGERSLRQIAGALGTSHRMLIYHFGSKDGLLVEVSRLMERRQRELLADLVKPKPTDDSGADASSAGLATDVDTAWQFWHRLTDPALWPHMRVFFELYGRALQGDPAATPMLAGVVHDWVEPMTAWLRSIGMPESDAGAHARLGLAVARGLLLDLLATGEQAEVDAAMRRFVTWSGSLVEPNQSP